MGLPLRVMPIPYDESVQLLGLLQERVDSGLYRVDCDGQSWLVPRALSCLLQPEVGDRVLLSGVDAQNTYLIAVLERTGTLPLRLDIGGDLHLGSALGNVYVEAGKQLHLSAQSSLQHKAPNMDFEADTIRVQAQACQLVSQDLTVLGKAIRVVSQMHEVVAERFSQMCKNVTRLTEHREHVRAGQLDVQAEHYMRLHARHTLVTAKELVKVNADQIHMG